LRGQRHADGRQANHRSGLVGRTRFRTLGCDDRRDPSQLARRDG
jgi:hypothetical protein